MSSNQAAPARALVTGAGGFAGKHLLRFLESSTGWELYGNILSQPEDGEFEQVHWVTCDLTDRAATALMIDEVRPGFVFHLAAQSNVQQAFKDPETTLMNNVVGQLHLLDALRESSPDARVLVACSSEQYGLVRPEDIPIDEDTLFRPNNPYAVSKIAQDALALQYYLAYGQPVIRVRPFNHIGPGQTEHFVASAFARQVALIEAGKQEPVILVGNLEAERDFTDVRDMARAYHLAVTQGAPGDVYNLGSGKGYTIKWLLDTLINLSGVDVEVRSDPARMRPSDIPSLVCDPTKFKRHTGWEPVIPLERTLADILEYWRGREGVVRET